MSQAPRDNNRVTTLLGTSSADGATPVIIYGDPTTNALFVQSTSGVTAFGKTISSVTGSASATFTIVAAVSTKRIKVIALSLITASTTAVTVTFKSGAGGTALATYPLQALSGTNFGLATAVEAPTFLFGTAASALLEMSFSAAQTVVYNLSYFSDDTT